MTIINLQKDMELNVQMFIQVISMIWIPICQDLIKVMSILASNCHPVDWTHSTNLILTVKWAEVLKTTILQTTEITCTRV